MAETGPGNRGKRDGGYSECDGAGAEPASGTSVWDMFANPVDRRRTILAVAAVSTQAASGAMYMIGMFGEETERKKGSRVHVSEPC